ncbi:thiamine pyrophosphate-binding protein, partial [Flavobacterium sp.]|uniref:thiamine pyrophosphate-binding protein n=1 Tax=Flavobacterium sp. TaxID=239 RepID=UPI002BA35986
MNTTKITGAQAVIKSLVAENVNTIFGYPGGAIMPIYDALYDYEDNINHILVRHEQGAIHAAQGFARTSGKTGVVFATSGPGATNLITGLADALIDSTPLVCITGQVASHLLGTDAFQETDVVGISMPITKWNCQVTKAEDIPAAIAKAFYIAQSGRPGPVLIDITKDAQFGEMNFTYEKCTAIRSYRPKPKLNRVVVEEAAKLINEAKKPYLLIGQGIMLSNAEKELVAFIEKTGIPVASTLLGLGAFPQNHPLYVGYLGMHGDYAPNIKTNECDVLIAVGMRFDDRVTGDVSRYAKQAKVIHVDIDAAELNKIIIADVAVHADAKEALNLLTELTKKKQHNSWLQEFNDAKKVEVETLQESAKELHSEELKMDEVIKMLSELTNREAVVVTDVGQ